MPEPTAALTAAVENDARAQWKPDRFGLAYRTIQRFAGFAMNTFFGDIDVVGLENIPAEGPVILVGNHKNQFVDAMMVVSVVRRKVSFLVAERSMHRRVIGDAARKMDAIPVIRPQDRARASPGVITGFDGPRLRILGSSDCAFATTVKKGEMIVLHGIKGVAPLMIQEVLSDTSVLIKAPVKPEDEADGTGGQPANLVIPSHGVSFKVIPKIDQSEVFTKVFDALCDGRCIGIFPEGGSSDRTDLLPLKIGVAIMALGAAARGAPVQIIPFGINYNEGNKWRSKVLVDVGKPLTINPAIMERYNMGAQREAQGELLKKIEGALRGVTFNAPDKHTLNILRTMRRLYQGEVKLPMKRFMELNRRFALAFGKFREDDRFLDLVARVHDYMEKVTNLGLVDRQVAALPPMGAVGVSVKHALMGLFSLIAAILLFILSIPGYLLYLPVLLRIRHVANQEVKRALAGSRVKVKGVDVEASQKIISGFIWFPLLHLCYTSLAVGLTVGLWPRVSPYDPGTVEDWFHLNAVWLIPLAVFIFVPVIGWCNIPIVDSAVRRVRWLPYHYLIASSMCRRKSPGAHIRLRRKELSLRVQDFFDKIIAPTFPEWEDDIIITREILVEKRRRSDHLRAVQIAEEIDEIAKESAMPDSPTLPGSRKTITELKSSMKRMEDDVGRFSNLQQATNLHGTTSPGHKFNRQFSVGMLPDEENQADQKQ